MRMFCAKVWAAGSKGCNIVNLTTAREHELGFLPGRLVAPCQKEWRFSSVLEKLEIGLSSVADRSTGFRK